MSASKGLEERKAPHVPQDFQKAFENLPFGGKNIAMFKRHITRFLVEALGDTPVVFLRGARQSGKSTLVQELARTSFNAGYITLDNAASLSAAGSDPAGFIAGLSKPAIIDEVQRVPGLFLAIKEDVDANISRSNSSTSWTGWPAVVFPSPCERNSAKRRASWFDSYVVSMIERDLRGLSQIRDITVVPNRFSGNPELAGRLFENFVVSEILKQVSWADRQVSVYHFRSQAGREVDVVLEDRAGTRVGIEIKLTASPTAGTFSGLRALQELAGKRFRAGILLYTGKDMVPFGKKLAAIPVSALWKRQA